ncbi:tetratricopeptide repeat-containing sulfotransferase family protein [Dyella amyloliquefaciens]|uniref:tetratricopeptide repeat-containing sulfotransferase family protein n=1 Tax=Dyella amyloliquefaciens TaxID=1770545 RepID=UPI00102EBF1E|nr:sulfotransferase [Dyella amyloliquefaciens]
MTANQAPTPVDRAAGLSPAARGFLLDAGSALARGQHELAERALASLLAMAPASAEAHMLQGVASQMRGNHAAAIRSFDESLRLRPDDAPTLMYLGISQFERGDVTTAMASFHRACERAPGMTPAWFNLGKALKVNMRREDACRAFEQVLKLDPRHVTARNSLADTQVSLGNISAAVASYREVLRQQPANHVAWHALANLKTESFGDADRAQLQQLFRQPDLAADARIAIGFALAKALEDHAAYAQSFEVLREANALKRRQLHWDAAAESRQVDAIMAAFAQPATEPVDATLGQEVIFIVSLPRSGSTLTEQILASHPLVEGADEITDLPQLIEEESSRRGMAFPQWVPSATADDWARLGREYLARTARWRQQRPRFTDKNMLNWQYLGAALAMLPGARVVNGHRDAVETCFACYRQLFSVGSHFSYDLEEMASHYADYARLCRFWQQRFPGQVLDHSYEALVAEPEARIRRLLDFCGLAFDPACLDFHATSRTVLSTASAAQVRQPLQKNTSRLANYEAQLSPLRERLGSAGLL